MIVEVIGVHHGNKGAMLMLEAIRARLAEALPQARLAVPASMPAALREQMGLLATPVRERYPLDLAYWQSFLPWWPDRETVPVNRIAVILDASGFGYGDYWGLPKLERRLNRRLRSRRKRCAAIMLPQALGAFAQPGMARAFADAVARLDLVYVRDDASWEHVRAVAGDDPKLRRAPDFTNLLHPELPAALAQWRGYSFLIPNEKMVAGKGEEFRRRYVDFLALASAALARSGRRQAILIHEGRNDQALAAEVNARLPVPLPVIDEPSPLVTKALIGAADLVISSRFHGLVSALSSAVPSLACGWSHKYAELMGDYGCARHLIDLDAPDAWDGAVQRFLADAADPQFRADLALAAAAERRKSEAMWDEVVAAIVDRAA